MGRKGSGSLVLMEALYHVDPPDPHHTEKKNTLLAVKFQQSLQY